MKSEIMDIRMKRQALKRQGWPIDIAQSALFFASDRSPQVTGQILTVDSGTSAGDTQNLIEEIMAVRNRAMSKAK